MKLSAALRLTSSPRLALVGAGGKTTALFSLARQYPCALITTTTHLAVEQLNKADYRFGEDDIESLDNNLPSGVIALTGEAAGDGRLAGLSVTALEALQNLAEARHLPLFIEADGSRLRPLKAPADHEPAIPPFVDSVVVVAGLSALGKPLSPEWVHRPERFASSSGLASGETITTAALTQVLAHPQAGLKNIPSASRRVVLLNQADTPELQSAARGMVKELLAVYHAVIIASLNPENDSPPIIYAVHEPVAGIVLAGGEARRLGQPKQLLEWDGELLVHRVARVALEAGLSPVVVVTGAYAEQVAAGVSDLPLRVVENKSWREGQSSSIRAGLEVLPTEVGAAIFLLADQPKIPPGLAQSLVETHTGTLAPIVAPLVNGQRGNPVLFDRETFHDLCALTGDVGGRALFAHYPITWVPWHDPSVLVDIDTASDLAKLT